MQEYKIYLMRRLAGPFLLILLTITGVALLSQSLRFIDLIINKGLGVSTFLYLCLLIIPSLLWITVPIALYIASVFCINKLYSESELTIFKASGLSDRQIISPFFFVCIISCLFCFALSIYILPKAQNSLRDLKDQVKNSFATVLIEEGVFSSPTNGLTIYVSKVLDKDTYKNLLIQDSRKEVAVTMMAQSAKLNDTENGKQLVLYNGSRQEVNINTKEFSMLKFERYVFDLNDIQNKNNLNRTKQADEKYLHTLIIESIFGGSNLSKKQQIKVLSETFHRLTWPFYCLILGLLSTVAFFKFSHNRAGFSKNIFRVSIVCFLAVIFAFLMKNIAGKNIFLATTFMFLVLAQFIGMYYVCLKKEGSLNN